MTKITSNFLLSPNVYNVYAGHCQTGVAPAMALFTGTGRKWLPFILLINITKNTKKFIVSHFDHPYVGHCPTGAGLVTALFTLTFDAPLTYLFNLQTIPCSHHNYNFICVRRTLSNGSCSCNGTLYGNGSKLVGLEQNEIISVQNEAISRQNVLISNLTATSNCFYFFRRSSSPPKKFLCRFSFSAFLPLLGLILDKPIYY